MNEQKKAVYQFHWNCGRQGDLDGVFIATPEEVREATGKQLYFGEVLGKHSEIYGTLDEGEITLITESEEVVRVIEEHGLESGFNPLQYLKEDQE